MRYYDITIADPVTGAVVKKWGSHPNGVFDPAAQNIEFDMLSAPYSTPMGPQALQVEGISLGDLGYAQGFTGLKFTMNAGMQKGLPLANPLQSGMITSGIIWQSFGNWQGVEMALNFVITPSVYSYNNPGNFTLEWESGMQLSVALQNTLEDAYPGYPIIMDISQNWVKNNDEKGFWSTMEGLAKLVDDLTKSNVAITMQNGVIQCYDSTYTPEVIQIEFVDLIGQPTWIGPQTIIFKLVLRADISSGSLVQLPVTMQNLPGMALTSAESLPSNEKYNLLFNGVFRVNFVRHLGNYRSSDGSAWTTILTCVPYG